MHYDYTADFETTTDEDDCRVWAYAFATIEAEPQICYGNSLDSFFEFLTELNYNPKVYFHNLKFDGEFIIHYLLSHGFSWVKTKKEAGDFTFLTMITGNGLFYKIEVYFKKQGHKSKKVTFLDSLKILNFSVEQIAKDFNLPIRKLKIDYKAKREVGHKLTEKEIDYISNDVGIMARALNKTFNLDLKRITMGSNALHNYKDSQPKFKQLFPVMSKENDMDIRRTYRGGWTYLNPDYAGVEVGSGCVIDKNSMHPSHMYFDYLPIGNPCYFEGEYQDDLFYPLYVQSLSCSFELKLNKLPCIQIKNSMSFKVNEWLTSSNGDLVNLCLTSLDLKLFLENYDVYDLNYHGGWKFRSSKGLFTEYIDYWTDQKIKAKLEGNTANYLLSKLLMNSLYGKFGTNPISIEKQPYLEDDVVKYKIMDPETKEPVYIPVATFITAYSRSDIIRSAQKIVDYSIAKYGKSLFVYADTDSLHTLLTPEEIHEIPDFDLDPYRLGAWDIESEFTRAKFLRQKCYMEEVNGKMSVHIAGLPRKLANFMDFDKFRIGFNVNELGKEVTEGKEKLRYKHVKGGVILKETDFTIK